MKASAASAAGSGSTCRIVTGAEYVAQITAVKSDRLARTAFQQLVLALAPPGAKLLDFGCGTGLDAQFYAGQGLTITAYDVDPQMCDYFTEHCRDLIEAGQVRLVRGTYAQFLQAEAISGIDLVTSNFAPLNLIADLRELFAKFQAVTRPGGRVLASVLSPYFVGDFKYGWWWRNFARLLRDGHYPVPGAQAPIVRRRLTDFAAQSAPHFRLTHVFRGLPPRWGPGTAHFRVHTDDPKRRYETGSTDSRGPGGAAWLRALSSRFMFLLFEKAPG